MKRYLLNLSNHKWLTLIVGASLIVLVVSLWLYLDQQRKRNLHELIKVTANSRLSAINTDLRTRLPALQRIVERWSIRGGTPKSEFIADANIYMNDLPGFQALAWVDTSFHVRWITPLKGNEAALNLNLAFEQSRRIALENARDSRVPSMTSPVDLVQGGKGLIIYLPIYVKGRFDGFLSAVLKITPLLDYTFKFDVNNKNISTTVIIDKQRVYQQKVVSSGQYDYWKVTSRTQALGHDIQVDVIPTDKFFINNRTRLPEITIAIGLLLTALITTVVFLYQRAFRIAKSAHVSNIELEKNKKQLQTILDSAVDGIIIINDRGLIQSINPAALTIFGYPPEELLGQNIKVLMPEPFHSEHDDYLQNYLKTGDKKIIGIGREAIGLCKDGSTFPLHLTVSEFSVSGKRMFSGILRDITEIKQTEDKIKISQNNLLEAQHIAHVGNWSLEVATGKITWSDEACHIFGQDPKTFESSYNSTIVLIHPDDRPAVIKATFTSLEDASVPYNIEYRTLPTNGPQRYIHAEAKVYQDKSGKAEKMIGTVQDITKIKQTEMALVSAKESAEQATRAKSEFLANMSHEIRSPMTAVLGFLELLQDSQLDSDQKNYVETAQNSASSLLTLINDILDFSKIEAGELSLENIEFDLHVLIEDTYMVVVQLANNKGLQLNYKIEMNVAHNFIGDPARLRQVLTNLISNAIKFTEQGEIMLTVSVQDNANHSPEIKQSLCFEVKDTGIGISLEAQKTLFSPFTQADGSTTRKYGGTGLGLSISKQLVKLMGGEIGLNSIAGQGSTFWFTAEFELPIESDVAEITADVMDKPANTLPQFTDVRVLFVDDMNTNQLLGGELLKNIGIEVEFANNGQQAVNAVEKNHYDLVFMDCQMPGMDGYAATKAIRAEEQAQGLARLPIIALTANAMQGDRENCLAAGMDDYISKPFSRADLMAMLARWLND